MASESVLKVLNVGSGVAAPAKLHSVFRRGDWNEVRLDIDANVGPDLVGDMTNMRDIIPTGTFDAIWSSHNIEHLYAHEAPRAILEFHRILRQSGFALITCPDIAAIAQLIVDGSFEEPAYVSPAGPINALDMLYGHSRSIASGNVYMAHHTGYTVERLGRLLLEGGFSEAWVFPGTAFDIWAVALMVRADREEIRRQLAAGGLDLPQ
ncbi:MAG: methyltransferase domain-containing protein [Roseiarcus sp.]|jgi:predicted SAM-dependent methyltransferase